MMFNLSVFTQSFLTRVRTVQLGCIFGLALLVSACAEFPGVYKVRVEQGNIIDQEMIGQLEAGQTKEQVIYILGSPLVKDTFTEDRWDYIYRLKQGDRFLRQKSLTVYFKNGVLERFEHQGIEKKHQAAEEEKAPTVKN